MNTLLSSETVLVAGLLVFSLLFSRVSLSQTRVLVVLPVYLQNKANTVSVKAANSTKCGSLYPNHHRQAPISSCITLPNTSLLPLDPYPNFTPPENQHPL